MWGPVRLGRRCCDGPVLAFIMLNPSRADERVEHRRRATTRL